MFFRFRTEAHWYSIVYLVRGAVLSCTIIVPTVVGQVFLLQLVMLPIFGLTCFVFPWRVWAANILDVVISFAVVLFCCMAAFFAEEASK